MAYIETTDVPAGGSSASLAAIVALARDAYSIKSVADATAQAQAVTDWPTKTGAAISAANPVIVWRQDLTAVNVSEDGTNWHAIYGGDTGWVAGTLDTGFTGSLRVRRVGNLVEINATVDGTYPEGNTVIGSIPAAYRPSATYTVPRPGVHLAGAYPAVGYVLSTGEVGVTQRSGASRTSAQMRGTWLLG